MPILIAGLISISSGSAVAGLFQAEIALQDNLNGRLEIKTTSELVDIIAVKIGSRLYRTESNGAGEFVVADVGWLAANSRLTIYWLTDDTDDNPVGEPMMRIGRFDYAPQPQPLIAGPLNSVTDTLSIGVAGAQDTHKIGFVIPDVTIGRKGEIWISFNTTFDAGGIIPDSTQYYDNDAGNDGDEPKVDTSFAVAQTVVIRLDNGTPAATGSRINLVFGPIRNNVAGQYIVTVTVVDSLGNAIYTPTSSSPFTIVPASLNRIAITPGAALQIPSDSLVHFAAAGYDTYNNLISGLDFDWAITVDSCGLVNDGIFRALKLGQCYITATTLSKTDSTGLLTIIPGPLDRFGVTGFPASVAAGAFFPNPIVVTAYDVNDNIKIDLQDSIYFFADDDSAQILFDESNLFQFLPADSGSHSFAGPGFIIKTAGLRQIGVTDLSDTTLSPGITVTPRPINSFGFTVALTQTAGVSFNLSVNNAVDQYGNLTNGNVIVDDYPGGGGGNSPDGVPPVFNIIPVSNGSGSAYQTLTNSVPTVLKGVGGTATVYTDTINVLPGVAGALDLSAYPDSITAGETFPVDPVVTVKDIFGNLKTNFSDTVRFSGAESFPPPYKFVPGSDAGQHVFSGDDFMYEIAGLRNLTVAYNGVSDTLTDTSSPITVYPAAIDDFGLLTADTVSVGEVFSLQVTGAVDRFDNAASGTVMVDTIGQNGSPSGRQPIVNNVQVINGSGSANQVLVRTGNARLKATGGSHTDTTQNIVVMPGIPGSINLVVASPQVSGDTLLAVSTVTIKDEYGNIKTDFDASSDSVVIGALSGGPLANNVLKQQADFTGGVADLVDHGVVYNGRGGPVVFNAASQSGVYGESNTVDVVSLIAEDLSLTTNPVVRLNPAEGTIRFRTLGSVAVNIVDITVFGDNGDQYAASFEPVLPVSIPGGVDTTFNFSFTVPAGLDPGDYPLSMKLAGNYAGILTYDSLEVFSDTMTVITPSNLAYLDGSLAPVVVSTGLEYSFGLRLRNDGGASINLADSSYIYFGDGSTEYRADFAQNISINPGAQSNVRFDSVTVDPAFISGIYSIKLYIFGSDLGGIIIDSLALPDSVRVESPTAISYLSNSLEPDTILTGATIGFVVRVNNAGQAPLVIDHDLSRLSFSDGIRQFNSPIDTSAGVRIDQINEGDTTLTFTPTVLSPNFNAGRYRPSVRLAGMQNQHQYLLNLAADSIVVLNPGQLRLDTLAMVSYNRPRVNVGQPFSLHGYLNNLGNEPVDSILLLLITDGNSIFQDTLDIGTLMGNAGAPFNYNITADTIADALETYQCSVIRAINRISGESAPVATPLDNTAAAVIEDSASLWIDSLYLSDYDLSTDQVFTVYARARHVGSNSYNGSNQLTIDFGGDSGFQPADSTARDIVFDQFISWSVTAPTTPRPSASAAVLFRGSFIDLNDSTTALTADSSRSTNLVVTDQASISHRASITGPAGAVDGLVSTGQAFTVTDSLFPAGNAGSSFGRLYPPAGVYSDGPLIQQPTAGKIDWAMHVAEQAGIDSIRLDCWTFDSNTGDSMPGQTLWIPIEIEQRSTLTFGLAITYPSSATDRIISPGGFFTLQADVVNLGDAPATDGELTLMFEDAVFTIDEPLIRSFTPNVPVEWHVTSPDFQILQGTQIAAVISAMPRDQNSGDEALAINDSTGLDVVIKNELPRLVLRDLQPVRGATVRGQPKDIYRFSLQNSTEIGNNQVGLISFAITLLAQNQSSVSDLVSASVLVVNGQSYSGVQADSLIEFTFDPPILIEPDSLVDIVINITPNADSRATAFAIRFGSDDVAAQVVIGGVFEQFIEIIQPDGTDFIVESPFMAILASDFVGSAKVNQNPYLAADGPLQIGYNLESDATLDIGIYAVGGEKIWEYQATPGSGQGTAGDHYDDMAVFWDGRGLADERVLSGVYYVLITNQNTGETAKLKVAVVW